MHQHAAVGVGAEESAFTVETPINWRKGCSTEIWSDQMLEMHPWVSARAAMGVAAEQGELPTSVSHPRGNASAPAERGREARHGEEFAADLRRTFFH